MMKKIILGVILAVVLLGAGGYMYLYKSHRDISAEAPAFVMPANQLQEKFVANYDDAVKTYLNKTIEVTGAVTEVVDSVLVLDEKVFCSLSNLKDVPKVDQVISVKGRCLGYDELFEQVKLDQCSIK